MPVKKLIKALLPPSWIHELKVVLGRSVSYRGNYESWGAAVSAARGYDEPAILEKVRVATHRVVSNEAVFERDSVCFDHEECRRPVLDYLLRVAAQNDSQLSVLDFGGSLGSFYNQHKSHFAELRVVEWSIVEQPHFVVVGRREFETDVLRFYDSMAECLIERSAQVLLLSSVLPYLPDPHGFIGQAIATGIQAVVIDRTAFLPGPRDRLVVQKVPPEIYEASYPAWFLGEVKVVDGFKAGGYRLEQRFDCEEAACLGGEFKGMVFERMDGAQ
ncbi:MAG: methyltransferase, TIGR04325 family [Deltaproteobacteria bacterium]|nr:MAG: methyltransferase, TIGR04325 family [Deltaproteobacteria bacterium]